MSGVPAAKNRGELPLLQILGGSRVCDCIPAEHGNKLAGNRLSPKPLDREINTDQSLIYCSMRSVLLSFFVFSVNKLIILKTETRSTKIIQCIIARKVLSDQPWVRLAVRSGLKGQLMLYLSGISYIFYSTDKENCHVLDFDAIMRSNDWGWINILFSSFH
jgi:hypothetical protein